MWVVGLLVAESEDEGLLLGFDLFDGNKLVEVWLFCWFWFEGGLGLLLHEGFSVCFCHFPEGLGERAEE